MRAVALVGWKKSGKTTLAVALAQELSRRGLRVGAVKHSHHGLDVSGTDTARLAEVCRAVAGVSPGQSAAWWGTARSPHDLMPLLGAQVLLVEGGKEWGWLPRILVAPGQGEDPAALVTGRELGVFGPAPVAGLAATQDVAVVADWVLERGFVLAGLDCGGCGKASCAELAQAIVVGQAQPQDCVAQSSAVRVRCGDRDLALGPFVERLVRATVQGLLSELKGYVPGLPVRIEME
ncbi:molybdopterin-guanine dinucleotide biosynthesis protein MobB [Thermodesulfomicrobium sp. WS]|uniref:molybdopterin-guanine dinucleotide biosynthesis protein MobB n=1 Tax=Thermodesulfomicrobium sp. WS TaxID=3004129 RepID=UPI002491D29E|nr:molybdopterin-guanine dinucleotide biosynthesis protein MobB [Thermodesulfomicrobium sp. WS]BDV00352.1 molybdopterin-guanine dinucleotide biosynthesis protein MobB [Thermodesulfomicrobium sp. WS]